LHGSLWKCRILFTFVKTLQAESDYNSFTQTTVQNVAQNILLLADVSRWTAARQLKLTNPNKSENLSGSRNSTAMAKLSGRQDTRAIPSRLGYRLRLNDSSSCMYTPRELWDVTCHIGITQCHPTQVNATCLTPNPSLKGWYSIYLPWRDGRLS